MLQDHCLLLPVKQSLPFPLKAQCETLCLRKQVKKLCWPFSTDITFKLTDWKAAVFRTHARECLHRCIKSEIVMSNEVLSCELLYLWKSHFIACYAQWAHRRCIFCWFQGGLTATDVFAVEWIQSGVIHFGMTVSYYGFVSDGEFTMLQLILKKPLKFYRFCFFLPMEQYNWI